MIVSIKIVAFFAGLVPAGAGGTRETEVGVGDASISATRGRVRAGGDGSRCGPERAREARR